MPKVVHFELPAENPEKLKKFYTDIFGWRYEQMPGNDYWFTKAGEEKERGIGGAIMSRRHADQPVTVTIDVKNLDATLREIEACGGTVVVPKVAIPGMGAYAFFKDPEANIVGVWEFEKAGT